MSPLDFPLILINNIDAYIIVLLAFGLPYYLIARRFAVDIFDPLFVVILADWFGSALVLFMYIQKYIPAHHFFYYVLSQIAFLIGLGCGGYFNNRARSTCAKNSNNHVMVLAWISCVVHFLATTAKWWLTGVPLFKVSRLGALVDSGGMGIIERFETGAFYILVFSVFFVWNNSALKRERRLVAILLLWVLIYILLSGSKGAMLVVAQIFFMTKLLANRKKGFVDSHGQKYIIFAFVALFALGVQLIQSGGDFYSAFFGILWRMVSFGDVYIYAYTSDALQYIRGDNPIIGIFGGFLRTFRLIPADWMYTNMGLQFTGIIYPDLDYFAGPNPRRNVFGYHYFGWIGVFFSFTIGLLIRWLQRRAYNRYNDGYFSMLNAFLLYFVLVSLSADVDYSMSVLASVVISMVAILCFFHLVRFLSHSIRLRYSYAAN